jgi:hypothetical protein
MSILTDRAHSVNLASFDPDPVDVRLWVAMRENVKPRAVWVYERSQRLRDLLDRLTDMLTYLYRERCDTRNAEKRTLLAWRISIVKDRHCRLAKVSRSERARARFAKFEPTADDEAWLVEDNAQREVALFNLDCELRAAEAQAIDALTLGLIPGDLVDEISRTSLVGHDG